MKSKTFKRFDKYFISEMHDWAIPTLRVALGIVFFWFGGLKVAGVTPVTDLVSQTYSFMPTELFMFVLGIWEVLIGLGLLLKKFLRPTLFLLWLQMLGTLFTFVLCPTMFFRVGNPFLLTVEGEFVVKNFVLIAASLVIGGYEVKPMKWYE
ncbi:hypothetical protein H6758_01025 [Candidatus Nomurabacteria bacterium]|nr:hypothetical protein [Candidatus Nomurabacteria bacterium]